MAIFELFSKKQKKLRGEVPEILSYDEIPEALRVQIVHIIQDSIGIVGNYTKSIDEVYEFLHKTLCREYGKFHLIEAYHNATDMEQVLNFFLQTKNVEQALDVIQLSFQYLDRIIRKNFTAYSHNAGIKVHPDEAIEELNSRFKEHGVGFSFEGSEIIRIDSTYMHAEITKPTISLLWNKKFAGANEEFLLAHEHYRHGRNKECLAECLKAFESTLKSICKEKKWPFKENDTAKRLIQISFENNLVPSFSQNQFTSLQNLLQSGVPTLRNKLGGHGQGQEPKKVSDEITRYALNLTGANIIFLIEESKIK